MLKKVKSKKLKLIIDIQFVVNIMTYIVTTTWFPAYIGAEISKIYQEIGEKFPPDDSLATTIIPIASMMTKKGMKMMSISEVKRGKLYEALSRTHNTLALFANVKEFKYKVELFASAKEIPGFQ